MSLLHPDSSNEVDRAARGEEYAKGSSHPLATGIFAAVLVSLAVGGYFLSGLKPPIYSGEIEQVWAHAQHTESSGIDANGASMAKESFDQVYVFALVKLKNESDKPLFLHNIMTNVTLADGIHSSYAATAADYDRVFIAYPSMPVQHGKALSLQTTIDPGQTVEGNIVSAFRLSKQQWDARKGLDYTFAFSYQPSLVLAPHNAVTDQ
ncbi:MAG: hypothetical protein ABR956_01800 [Terracidiphilus sp.]|jgi:hypothetical protein